MSGETRAHRRIRRAAESRGYQLVTLEWQPWHDAGEKAGIGGGWFGTLDRDYLPNTWPGNEIVGLSVEEVLWSIDHFLKPPESCECPRPEYAGIYPPTPQWEHDEGCRWRIRYWLPWWGPRPTPHNRKERP